MEGVKRTFAVAELFGGSVLIVGADEAGVETMEFVRDLMEKVEYASAPRML